MTAIYNYHPVTNEYLHESTAALDPLESKPLIPAFATLKKPPTTDSNEIAVFINNHWTIEADFRGVEYWLADGTNSVIENIGEALPDNYLTQRPQPLFSDSQLHAIESVKGFATETRATLADHADQYKLAGWNDKVQRAQRVVNNTATDADFSVLNAECAKRGKQETSQQLAQKQLDKAQHLATVIAVIDGMESAAIDQIKSKQKESTLNELMKTLLSDLESELIDFLSQKNEKTL